MKVREVNVVGIRDCVETSAPAKGDGSVSSLKTGVHQLEMETVTGIIVRIPSDSELCFKTWSKVVLPSSSVSVVSHVSCLRVDLMGPDGGEGLTSYRRSST